jgi:iron complex transport system substrate-binding protein
LQAVAARAGWSNIAAVRQKQVFALDDDIASRWGPRVALFVKDVARAVRTARR